MGFFARQSDWINSLFTPSKTTNTQPLAVSDDVQLVHPYAPFYSLFNKGSQISANHSVGNPAPAASSALIPEFSAAGDEFLVVENFCIQASTNNVAFDGDTYRVRRQATPPNPFFVLQLLMWFELAANANRNVQLFGYGGTVLPSNFVSANSAKGRFLIPAGTQLAVEQNGISVRPALTYNLVFTGDVWRVPIGTAGL